MPVINFSFCSFFWTYFYKKILLEFFIDPPTLQAIPIALGYHPESIAE